MTTIPQNTELLKNLFNPMADQRQIAGQQRVYERLELLVLAELFTFGRHTVTQFLMSLGLTEQAWSAWYRLFSEGRFNYEAASAELFAETLKSVAHDEVYGVAGDAAQRWFNGSWLIPQENGYSRAVPLRWLPAFTEKSQPQTVEPLKEWQVCVQFLLWLQTQFNAHQRPDQPNGGRWTLR